MSQWSVEFESAAEKGFASLDGAVKQRIIERLDWLREHFAEINPLPLGGPWRGFFKLRVGDWRIIYEIEHAKSTITVYLIDHRDKVYKRRRI